MPRAPTTLDPFNAVAEPRRRAVLAVLAQGERPVNDLVILLGWPQPQVSKHLSVLLKVGLVRVRSEGRQRLYTLNGERLKPIHDWVKAFERFWQHQLGRIKARAEAKARLTEGRAKPRPGEKEK
jgi:DNA-binding transcriptional ArsR family regulator